MFHVSCLDEVKEWSPQCPNCRATLKPNWEAGIRELLPICDPVLDYRSVVKNRISSARDAVRYVTLTLL
jgi:hypothetical protein